MQPVHRRGAFTRRLATSPQMDLQIGFVDMHYNAKVFAAIVGGSAVVTLGALSVGVMEDQMAPVSVAGPTQMSLGATSTESAPPSAPAIGQAAPAIKGPAPLPKEEQGLPG
jgi:hypothetical protein